jgi:hypothetical protein
MEVGKDYVNADQSVDTSVLDMELENYWEESRSEMWPVSHGRSPVNSSAPMVLNSVSFSSDKSHNGGQFREKTADKISLLDGNPFSTLYPSMWQALTITGRLTPKITVKRTADKSRDYSAGSYNKRQRLDDKEESLQSVYHPLLPLLPSHQTFVGCRIVLTSD